MSVLRLCAAVNDAGVGWAECSKMLAACKRAEIPLSSGLDGILGLSTFGLGVACSFRDVDLDAS